MKTSIQPNQPGQSRRKGLFAGACLLFAAAALLVAYFAFMTTRQAVASWEMTQLEGLALTNPTSQAPVATGAASGEDPAIPVILPQPNPWNGASRVTVLVMGVDYRDWEKQEGPPRSDTMILFTVDPLSHTAGILSIPRDLWVDIPGMGYNKINTAYRFGDLYKVPGGGPGLAMKTVSNFLGVPVDFYAQIDFYAFEKFINKIGGIDVNIPAKITVDPLGPNNTVILKPGLRHLNGAVALAYARNRYTANDDYDRSQRQHQVIFAIRDKVLSLDTLPVLISRAPDLYRQLSKGIRTNLSLDQAIQLAWLAQQIPPEAIQSRVIGPQEVTFEKSPDGQDIDKPITAKIRLLRDEMFMDSSSTGPSKQGLSAEQLVAAEAPVVRLVNDSGTEPLGEQAAAYLQKHGIQVKEVKVSAAAAGKTKIINFTGKPYTLQYLVSLLAIQPDGITSQYEPGSPVDFEIQIGKDWKIP
ncbi:MAG: LCP family protein [Omnitrophica WOR_2 bacterium]